MCEKPPFRRWLIQDLVDLIRAIPRFIKSPGFEQTIGFIFTAGFLFYAFFIELPEVTRIALALLIIPSFIIYKHGTYRTEVDC